MEKPSKTLASHLVRYEDTSLRHAELRCCCLQAGEVGWPADTALQHPHVPAEGPQLELPQAEHRALCTSALEEPCLTTTRRSELCAWVTARESVTCVSQVRWLNIHSGLKKCWSLCQERRIKTEATECRPKVGGSGRHFNEKSVKFSSYLYSWPGRNTRFWSFFPCYTSLPTATEASFKAGAKTSRSHYFLWCFRWFCFKLWTQTSCLLCFLFSASVRVSCKWM